jgi:peptidoglycan/xylan/chitin deacetylase (PgdA/CDA1 family)
VTGPIPYRSARTATGWSLPGDARLAVWVVPNVEVFPLDEKVPGGSGTVPDVPAFAARDYGARVGFWRVLDALTEAGVRATAAVNGDVCAAYPEVTAAMVEAGWEAMGHSRTNSRRLPALDEAGEVDEIAAVTGALTGAFGVAPQGWLGAGLHERWTTPAVLRVQGYSYVADWVSDDRPDVLAETGLVSVPYSLEANDKPAFDTWRLSPDEFADLVIRQFDVLWREGAEEPRVLGMALHPYRIGVPHRIDALRRLLGELRSRDGVWWATGSEIADRYVRTATGR